jgi:hypothetical protein
MRLRCGALGHNFVQNRFKLDRIVFMALGPYNPILAFKRLGISPSPAWWRNSFSAQELATA